MAYIALSMTKQLFFMFFPCCRKSKPCVSWQAFAYHRRDPGRALFAFAAQHSSCARMLRRAPAGRPIGNPAQRSVGDASVWPPRTVSNDRLLLMRNVKRVKKLAPRRLCADAITSTYG